MVSSRTKLVLLFIAVITAGIVLSYVIYWQGQLIKNNNTVLLKDHIPVLTAVSQIEQALSEHERICYEFYATQDSAIFNENLTHNFSSIHSNITELDAHPIDHEVLARLVDYIEQQAKIAESLEFELTQGSYPQQWDNARALLAEMTDLGNMARPQLAILARQVELDLANQQSISAVQLDRMSIWVFCYAMVMIVLAVFAAVHLSNLSKDALEKRKLALFAERNPNAVFSLTWQGDISYVNPTAEMIDNAIHIQLIEQYAKPKIERLKQQSNRYVTWTCEFGTRVFHATLHQHRDIEAYTLYLEDITERHQAQQDLAFLAFHDPLTELPNRQRMEADGKQLLSQAGPETLCAIVLGIDRFSLITSTHGYQVGDEILLTVKQRLSESLPTHSTKVQANLYRFTGTKFIILVQANSIQSWITQITEEIRHSLLHFIANSHGHFYLSVSQGVAINDAATDEFEKLLQNADIAYTHARKEGGNRVITYSPVMREQEVEWLAMEVDLRLANENRQFQLAFQPKIQTHALSIQGVEALIRWQHPEKGFISPADFIPVAEQSGLIIEIGEWIIETVCQHLSLWNQSSKRSLSCAINISPLQFLHHNFLTTLDSAVAKYAISPAMLELEITEGVLMHDIETSIALLNNLHQRGFKISIDDFGTGYSSLSYLKLFSLDTLKIDKSFIDNICQVEADRAIVKTIIDLAKHLNLSVVAEGVESFEQYQLLADYGCDEIQGYYFSKPISSDELLSFSVPQQPH